MTENNRNIRVSYEMTAPLYESWQTGEDESVLLNRMIGDVYVFIDGEQL